MTLDSDDNATTTSSLDSEFQSRHTPSLSQIEAFLMALTNADPDGRVLITRAAGRSSASASMRFLLLNPENHFSSVLSQAHAVILAGGTMQPVSETVECLLSTPAVPATRLRFFSCDHIIPPENLLAVTLGTGPSNKTLEFSYQNRSSNELVCAVRHPPSSLHKCLSRCYFAHENSPTAR